MLGLLGFEAQPNLQGVIPLTAQTSAYRPFPDGTRTGVYTLDGLMIMDRSRDPERVALEVMANLHDANDSGIIRIASELKICDGCLPAIEDFEKLFDHRIQVETISTNIKNRPRWNG
jgi:hypothetical protein